MKKRILLFLMAFCVCVSVFAAGREKRPQTVYVSVENGVLKEKPSRFGKELCTVDYGESLKVLGDDGEWYQVFNELTGDTGWISVSMVTKKKIVVGRVASADADEIALAGKGFSQEVEDLYSQSGDGNYEALAAVEALSVSDYEVLIFLQEGNLLEGD